jgi:hypothetical protein
VVSAAREFATSSGGGDSIAVGNPSMAGSLATRHGHFAIDAVAVARRAGNWHLHRVAVWALERADQDRL